MVRATVRPQRGTGHALLYEVLIVRGESQNRGCLFGALLPPLSGSTHNAVGHVLARGHAPLLGALTTRGESRNRDHLSGSLLPFFVGSRPGSPGAPLIWCAGTQAEHAEVWADGVSEGPDPRRVVAVAVPPNKPCGRATDLLLVKTERRP